MQFKIDQNLPHACAAYYTYAQERWGVRKGHLGPHRVVSIGEHMLRIVGLKHGPLYGTEGNRLAQDFGERDLTWTGNGACDWEPGYITQSKMNKLYAYIALGLIGTAAFLTGLHFIAHHKAEVAPMTAALVGPPMAPQLAIEQFNTTIAASPAPAQFGTPAYTTTGPITIFADTASGLRARTIINR
jgi:hypothetical protein